MRDIPVVFLKNVKLKPEKGGQERSYKKDQEVLMNAETVRELIPQKVIRISYRARLSGKEMTELLQGLKFTM